MDPRRTPTASRVPPPPSDVPAAAASSCRSTGRASCSPASGKRVYACADTCRTATARQLWAGSGTSHTVPGTGGSTTCAPGNVSAPGAAIAAFIVRIESGAIWVEVP